MIVHREFVDAVTTWGVAHYRDLPWRRTRDPWAVLIAEVMLQQTQVARVVPKWTAFLERFPTIQACADAEQADVVRLWQGLGYPRRAKALHDAARTVRDRHHGVLPSDFDELRALPGVGDYTSRAVRVFAFEIDDAILDTNVARILARAVFGRRLRRTEAQLAAASLVRSGSAWSWNQTMLDFGATVCLKRNPRCDACPVQERCSWRLVGGPDPAERSAAVSTRQAPFEGSDRQGRGRIIAALGDSVVAVTDLPAITGWTDTERGRRVVESLIADGLITQEGHILRLR